jgi:hypothetical protein
MLIVGTRGRSLGGFQGLVSNRNSFSKWCLQYSPIPVVVVRPPEKRDKKKLKRANDPTRQNYLQILQESSHGTHEASTSSGSKMGDLEFLPRNTPEIEAHEVAAAMSLPAKFDPTLKPINIDGPNLARKVSRGSDATSTSFGSASPESGPSSPVAIMKSPKSAQLESPPMSDAESDSEDDGEFEAVPGHTLLAEGKGEAVEKQKKLHQMEVGEAAALANARKLSTGSNYSNASGSGELDDGNEEA